jgi:hypothetical protein
MGRPQASLGLVLLGLLGVAGWGCSKGPSQDDAGTTGGAEVKKAEDGESPRSGRSARVVGKVARKMQEDSRKEAENLPPGMRNRKYGDKTAAPPWEADAPDFGRRSTKTPAKTLKTAKTFYEPQDKTEYKTDTGY